MVACGQRDREGRGGVGGRHQLHDEILLLLGPLLLAHRRAEVVVPPLARLLAEALPRQLRGDLGPSPRPQLRHELSGDWGDWVRDLLEDLVGDLMKD